MELILSANTTIQEIKKQFSKYFPYLKLEFFTGKHDKGEGSPMWQKVSDKSDLIEITGVLKEGVFYFDPSINTGEFEQKLQHDFGIPVQVFRKSGEHWLETLRTDELSLEEQNSMGKSSMKSTNYNINTLFL